MSDAPPMTEEEREANASYMYSFLPPRFKAIVDGRMRHADSLYAVLLDLCEERLPFTAEDRAWFRSAGPQGGRSA